MRAVIFTILVICFFASKTPQLLASRFYGLAGIPGLGLYAKKEKVSTGQNQESKRIRKTTKATRAQQALIEKKRKQLNNTEWEIELTLLSNKKIKQVDVITFKNNQFVSAKFSQLGFSATNYTLSLEKEDKIVWETMQTSEKYGIAFWRGELDLGLSKMQGILSQHVDDKTTNDYSFSSISKKTIRPSKQ